MATERTRCRCGLLALDAVEGHRDDDRTPWHGVDGPCVGQHWGALPADTERVWVTLVRETGVVGDDDHDTKAAAEQAITEHGIVGFSALLYRDDVARKRREQRGEPEPPAPPYVEYRATFGTMYAAQRHPRLPTATPDGWLAVEVPDDTDEIEITARTMVIELIGRGWSSIYHPDDEGYPASTGRWARYFPAGEIDRIGDPRHQRPDDRCGTCWHTRSSHSSDGTGCYECPDSGPYPCRGMRGQPFLRGAR